MAEAITTAARAVLGRFCSRLGAKTSSRAMTTAPVTPVSWVLEPADSATGVREELLLIEKPWKKPAPRLAEPRPIISWLGLTCSPVPGGQVRESTLVSAKATTAMAIAPTNSGPEIRQALPPGW